MVRIMDLLIQIEASAGGLAANLEDMGSLLEMVPAKKLQALSDGAFGDVSGKTKRNFTCGKKTVVLFCFYRHN